MKPDLSKAAEMARKERCPTHPHVMRLDEATNSGIMPASLCPVCEPDIILVDTVRRLFARRET